MSTDTGNSEAQKEVSPGDRTEDHNIYLQCYFRTCVW